MTILLTGPTGNVGSEVLDKLKNRDSDIRLVLRNANEIAEAETGKVYFDYANPSIPRFAWRMMRRGEKLKFIAVMVGLYSTVRFGYADETTTTLGEMLGRAPISLEKYVADYSEWWRRF